MANESNTSNNDNNFISDQVFDEWNEVKKRLNRKEDPSDFFVERDVWWCGVGQNIGIEAFGKNENFSRPVLIFKRLSRSSFLGVPLTSQEHHGTWYVDFYFRNRRQFANLAQVRVFDASRLYWRVGKLSERDYKMVRKGFHELYCR